MIKLAFEIPTSCLPRFSKMTNYDFALTHLVEQDNSYAKFYLSQSEVLKENCMKKGVVAAKICTGRNLDIFLFWELVRDRTSLRKRGKN